MNLLTVTYIVYLVISISLTVWVARTLFRNGRLFLVEVFGGDEKLADSVNHLLVVGFYLLNLGYVSLALKLTDPVAQVTQVIEALSLKVGLVLVVLGVVHFSNLFIFQRLRHQSRRPLPPPGFPAPLGAYGPPPPPAAPGHGPVAPQGFGVPPTGGQQPV